MTKKVGTVCFIVDSGKVLLALIEYSPNDKKWNGVGGFVELGEDPEDAVVREIREETHIKVENKDLIKGTKRDYRDYSLIPYRVNKWNGELKIKDQSLKELKWFKFDEVPYDQMHEDNKYWLPNLLKKSVPRVGIEPTRV